MLGWNFYCYQQTQTQHQNNFTHCTAPGWTWVGSWRLQRLWMTSGEKAPNTGQLIFPCLTLMQVGDTISVNETTYKIKKVTGDFDFFLFARSHLLEWIGFVCCKRIACQVFCCRHAVDTSWFLDCTPGTEFESVFRFIGPIKIICWTSSMLAGYGYNTCKLKKDNMFLLQLQILEWHSTVTHLVVNNQSITYQNCKYGACIFLDFFILRTNSCDSC